ncbi:AzlC family ABC transporter permease [uncultured Marinococcus sp.]|uniref:AzlC family ABC transporter permease n=1 Tax=uncultured Marinococcus sp. TaxID=487012 RepID=UPI002608927F|nr:AzlC family ABC transporter permease [uncultured Marinococcus sp.]
MTKKERVYASFQAAFPQTLPIMAGFLFVGTAYGIFMHSLGFHPLYAIGMSLLIFAGSMEFVAGHLLIGAFQPMYAALLTLVLNSRHLFYGLSLLRPYHDAGLKKYYLIFGLCDESFAVNSSARVPDHVDTGWFMFFVTLLNHSYWVAGAALGSIAGKYMPVNTEGLTFVMTALFTVIFLDQWMDESSHQSSVIGLGVTFLCLLLLGPGHFILPALVLILCVLLLMEKRPKRREALNQ